MVRAGEVVLASHLNTAACRVNRTTTQSATHNASLTVAFNTEVDDPTGMHSTSTNNSRVNILVAGWYVMVFTGSFESGTYSRAFCSIVLNGTSELARNGDNAGSGSFSLPIQVTAVALLDVGDYVEATVFQSNGSSAARNLEAVADRSPYFAVAKLGN